MSPPNDEKHACDWQAYARHLEKKLAEREAAQKSELDALKEQIAALGRQVYGKKSEKLPSLEREARKEKRHEAREEQQAEANRKRRENAIAKTKLETTEYELKVPLAECSCPKCGSADLRPVGRGKTSTVLRYVPGRFVRDVYRRETRKCRCGEYIVTASAPEKALEGTRYDEGFVAHLMVSKCGDSIPLYRLEKQYRRAGVSISRATMNELLHRHAELLEPLGKCLVEEIAKSEVVLADETSIKLQSAKSKAWMWAFLAGNLIAYRFSPSRSGATPREVLGTSKGTLLVDAYTGYNSVTGDLGRQRAGCLAHARRKLFEARAADESVGEALELIQQVYRVEHDAKEQGLAQSEAHLAMRQKRAAPAMQALKSWLDERKGRYSPKSALAGAVGYAHNHWTELTRFLDNARIPVDNNRSEAALRVVALGRKNFLFVGHESAGKNLAGLYSLIATCEACGKNPMEYLPDVMRRVSTHPAAQIRELLPDRWQLGEA